MGIQAEIVSVGQQMEVDSGKAFNNMVLRLPNGHMCDVIIDDATLQAITRMIGIRMVQKNVVNAATDIPSQEFGGAAAAEYGAPGEEQNTSVFGGEEPVPPADEEPPPPQPIRAQSVSRDEMGYPIVRGQGMADPGEVVAPGERDEDGVAQA